MHKDTIGALVDFARRTMGVELQPWQRDFIRSTYGPLMYARDRVFWTPNLLYRPGEYQGPAGPLLPRPWLVTYEIPPVDLDKVTWSLQAKLHIAAANAISTNEGDALLTKGGWNSAGISRIHSSEDETTPVYHVYHDNGREDDVKRPWPKDDLGESDDLIDEDDDALTTEELHDMHIPGQPPEPSAEDLEFARQHAGVVAAYERFGFSRQESMALLFQELHADLAREIYNRDNPF